MEFLKIAVAIPSYSREELLLKLIESVPISWQVFVSDNDSSLLPMMRTFGPNVFVSHVPNLIPIFANWNRALSLVGAQTTHVLIPSNDDLFLPTICDSVTQAVSQYPAVDVFIFGCDFCDGEGGVWPGYRPKRLELLENGGGFLKFIRGVDVRMPGIVFRKEFLLRIGAFDERFQLTAADSELIQRALLLGTVLFVPKVIGLYRVWSGALTHSKQASDQWIDEVVLWTDKIANLLNSGHHPGNRHVNIQRFKDEILARNLLAGLHNLIAKNDLYSAKKFMARYPIPAKADLLTRIRLMRCGWLLRNIIV